MKVKYIIGHLDKHDKNKVIEIDFLPQEKWQKGKEEKIIKLLESGMNPLKINPIRLAFHESKEEFRVQDGISRLRVFRKKKIRYIHVELEVGEW